MPALYPHYFDANATYGPTPAVLEIVEELQLVGFNPNSVHGRGQKARAALEQAREALGMLLGIGRDYTLFFNSGASEGNNAVVANFARGAGSSIVTDSGEHSSILAPLAIASAGGTDVRIVSIDPDGGLDSDKLAQACDETTTLVTVMSANNETGCVNPLRKIVEAVRACAPKAVIHSDVVQVLGKLPFSMSESGLDIVTLSGHKFGALSGVGAVAVRGGIELTPSIVGGPQEQKRRAGTENVLGILTMGAAANECLRDGARRGERMRNFRSRFESEVVSKIAGAEINCSNRERIPNTCSMYLPGIRTDDLLVALDREGISVSAGAACSSGTPKPSHVLKAMGHDLDRIKSTLRVSFRADHEDSDLDVAFPKFLQCVQRCRL